MAPRAATTPVDVFRYDSSAGLLLWEGTGERNIVMHRREQQSSMEGIMVTSIQQVIHDELKKDETAMEMRDIGVKSEADVADTEQQTRQID